MREGNLAMNPFPVSGGNQAPPLDTSGSAVCTLDLIDIIVVSNAVFLILILVSVFTQFKARILGVLVAQIIGFVDIAFCGSSPSVGQATSIFTGTSSVHSFLHTVPLQVAGLICKMSNPAWSSSSFLEVTGTRWSASTS